MSKTPSTTNEVQVQLLKEQTLNQRQQSQLLNEVVQELKKDKEEKKTIADEFKTVNQKLQQQIVAFIIAGLAVIGVFAWKQVIDELAAKYLPLGSANTLRSKVISAIVITFVVVIFTYIFKEKLGFVAATTFDSKIVEVFNNA